MSTPVRRSPSTRPAASAPRSSWRGARVLELLRDGVPPGDVAVVFREPGRYASLVEQVFGSYGVPYSIDRAVPFGHTGIGRGLLALIRCASLAGSAEDLLAYCALPGCSGSRDWPTAWRRRCASRAPTRPSRRVGSGRRALAAGRARPPAPGPGRRCLRGRAGGQAGEAVRGSPQAPGGRPVRSGAGRGPRAAHGAGRTRRAARVLGPDGARPDAARVHRVLEQLQVHLGETPQPDRVQVASPESIRARRFEAVFVCGLQEEFPRGAPAEPFLSDDDRRAIASASGLMLPIREDRLDRALPVLCLRLPSRARCSCSRRGRATRRATPRPSRSSWTTCASCSRVARAARPLARGRDLEPGVGTHRRGVGPGAGRRRTPSRGAPSAALGAPLLAQLASRDAVSAAALERFADCPVKWLVESVLDPESSRPIRGRWCAARTRTRCSSTPTSGCEETGERRVSARTSPAPSASCSRSSASAEPTSSCRRGRA